MLSLHAPAFANGGKENRKQLSDEYSFLHVSQKI
jgi:hypothetical protein